MTIRMQSIEPFRRWYLYILLCRDRTLYTGITSDVPRRLKMHNRGTASRYTRSRLPVRLIYQEYCSDRSSALQKEYAIKQLSKMEKEEYIRRKSRKPETWSNHPKMKEKS
jgi:predicted GIY-YIG superfamily endonuclease